MRSTWDSIGTIVVWAVILTVGHWVFDVVTHLSMRQF